MVITYNPYAERNNNNNNNDNLIASFPLGLAMTERLAFCFNNSPFSFSVSVSASLHSFVKEEE